MKWTPERIKALRKGFGDTQEQFAERLDVALATIQVWEQGRGEPIGPACLYMERLENDLREAEKQPA